ncbi:hypothetical protein ACJJTC_003878 [Scirpophaga incertulas]
MSHTQHAVKFFLLTGEPGVGKTTLTKKLNSILNDRGIKTSGFYTEEVRCSLLWIKQGYDVVSLDGIRGRLAREVSLLPEPINFKFGKYGVLVQEFEKIALPTLLQLKDPVMIIDEIGKMEFYSNSFKLAIREIFRSKSDIIVLATIPLRSSDSLIESIRHDARSKVWTVTRANRNTIHEDILKELASLLNLV